VRLDPVHGHGHYHNVLPFLVMAIHSFDWRKRKKRTSCFQYYENIKHANDREFWYIDILIDHENG
jgi:hypothetical protein